MSRVPWPGTRRVASVLALLVLLALVAPFVVFAVPQVVGAEHSYVVLSGSMEPYMSAGDVVVVDAVPADSIAVGDVITYSRDAGRSTTTHRVVDFVETDADGTTFRTKGDANPDEDRYLVRDSQVVGKVVYVVPYVGHVVGFAGTPMGYVSLVLVPLVLLVLNEAWTRLARPRPSGAAPADGPVPAADGAAPADDGPGAADGDVVASLAVGEPGNAAAEEYAVAQADLSLSLVVLGVLVTYSGWHSYRSIAAAAPELPSVMLFAGGLVALLLVAGARVSAARRRRGAGGHPTATDGGSDAPVVDPATDAEGGGDRRDPDADDDVAAGALGAFMATGPTANAADAGGTPYRTPGAVAEAVADALPTDQRPETDRSPAGTDGDDR